MQAGLVGRFTFVPMLTALDDTGHGARVDRGRAKAGTKNRELMDFLDGCVEGGKRDIKQLRSFFESQNIKIRIYREDEYFSHRHRREYFELIVDEMLSDSLVFVDPDVGLEVQRPGEKHILYSEIKELYQRMSENSILMLYQYLPRLPRQDFLNWRCTELRDRIMGDYPICIDDNEVAFFFLTKDEHLEHELAHVIGDYAERYSS